MPHDRSGKKPVVRWEGSRGPFSLVAWKWACAANSVAGGARSEVGEQGLSES